MKNKVVLDLPQGKVEGTCDPKWQSVLDVFVENFRSRHEVGASRCLFDAPKNPLRVLGVGRSALDAKLVHAGPRRCRGAALGHES